MGPQALSSGSGVILFQLRGEKYIILDVEVTPELIGSVPIGAKVARPEVGRLSNLYRWCSSRWTSQALCKCLVSHPCNKVSAYWLLLAFVNFVSDPLQSCVWGWRKIMQRFLLAIGIKRRCSLPL